MKKIVKTNLISQITAYLQEEIQKGTWKPGEKIPSENELAAFLGVSRMSLRSAIQRCNAMGLTETRVGEGTYVCKFNLRNYFDELYRMRLLGNNPHEINDLRFILQIGCMQIAMADGYSAIDYHEMECHLKTMEQAAAENDMETFHEADEHFHHALCRLCKNSLLYNIYDAIEFIMADITRQNVVRSVNQNSGFTQVIRHHRELMDGIRDHDINRFTKAMMDSREHSRRYYPEQKNKNN